MNNKGNTLYWIVLAALGLFLVIWHNAALDIVCKIVAAGLVLASAAGIYGWWKDKSKAPEALAGLLGSVAFCIIGLWIFFKTGAFVRLINVVLGLVMIFCGAYNLYREWKSTRNTVVMVLACLAVVIGIIIACNNAATTWVVVAAGLGLIYTAVTGYLAERAKKP